MQNFITQNWQWLLTSIVTVLGFTLTYFGVKRNFKYEVGKLKQEVALKTMQEIPYKICELMDEILKVTRNKKPITSQINNLMQEILSKILCYGSKDATIIAIYMQQLAYKNAAGENQENKNLIICVYSLLISQIKYDLTSEIISADSYLKLRLSDYEKNKNSFISGINSLIDELKLKRKFKLSED